MKTAIRRLKKLEREKQPAARWPNALFIVPDHILADPKAMERLKAERGVTGPAVFLPEKESDQ